MSDVPRFSEAFEGCVVLANQLMASWTPLLTEVSSKLASGTYKSGDVATDFPKVVKLVVDSAMAVGSESVDVISILSSDFSEHKVVAGFNTDANHAATTRKLTLKGDLVSASGLVLPKDKVKIVPPELDPHVTGFALDGDYDGVKARTYDGWVVATDPKGGTDETFVSVTVG